MSGLKDWYVVNAADVRLGMLVRIADIDSMRARYHDANTTVNFTGDMKPLCGMTGVVTKADPRPYDGCYIIGELNRLFLSDHVKSTQGDWYLHAFMFDDITPVINLVSDHRLTLCEQLENADPSQYIGILNRS